jgi:FkbM family methyltransferase
MKLAIIDIIGIPYDGTTVYKQGLGGSESAVTLMGKELSDLGFEVTVFNNCIDHAQPGVYDGVTYRHLNDLAQDHYFDIVISSRTVIPFVDPSQYDRLGDGRSAPYRSMNLYDRILSKAKMRILWMHDTFCLGDILIEELATSNRITDIFTLSDWHTSYILNCDHGKRRNFEVLKNKVFITRNGAKNYKQEVDIAAKDRNLFVYNASVTKGMIPLINHIWPRVKQYIPNAQLKVIGGFYKFSEKDEPDQQEKDWRNMAFDPSNPQKGIEFTGIIPQNQIAEILSKANFMIYPCAFPETFGISTLESLLYNTPSITCRFGALEEIAIDKACYLIDYAVEPNSLFQHINAGEQIDKFVKAVVDAYNNPYLHQQKQYYCNVIKDIAGWDSVAQQWRQHMFRKCGEYLTRDQYREVSNINHRFNKIYNRRTHNTVELEDYKPGVEQPIVVISTFYNAEQYIERCIQSVAQQDYENYHHILIDDCSTDNSFNRAVEAVYRLPKSVFNRFSVVKSDFNKGAHRNQIETIRRLTNDDAIIIILDGDDSLVNDNSIFSYYNNIYDGSTEFTYGSCWSMVDNIPLISQPYPEDIKKRKAYRQHKFNWGMPYTHLRTFKKGLANGLPDRMFTDSNGNWYKAGGDGAVFYAIIEQADPNKVKCLQDVVYNYNDINPLNDYKVNGSEQNIAAADILTKTRIQKYTVVVPTMWKLADQFVEFANKLCACESVGELIIINNDNTKTPTGLDNPKIRMYDFGRNIYVNPAWNLGVEQAKYSHICVVNDDVVFDTAVFERLQDMLTADNGLFGLCPGVDVFEQPPVTDKTIDIIPWTGQHTYGFGCLFFFNKAVWQTIPQGLDIYFGDNWAFDLQLAKGRQNYIIANMDFFTQFAATTKDQSITNGFLERERPIYEAAIAELRNPKPAPVPVVAADPQRKKRILIGIPTAKNIETETFKAIYDLEVPDGYETDFQCFYGYNIDQVRNLIAHWTVNHYDYLFSVDSDIAFERDTLKKLLAHDKDVVSGLYIQRKPTQHILEIYEHNQRGGVSNMPYEKLKGRSLVEIAGCGFGCVLVKTEVFKSVGYPQFEYHSAIDHSQTISEDNDFCRKARDKGFHIYADPSIQCRHIGSYTFTVDNNIQAVTDEDPVTARLRYLGNHKLMPNTHVDYLRRIREEYNFVPKVVYDIGACVLHWTDAAKTVWNEPEYIAFEAMTATEFLYKERNMRYNIGLLTNQDGKELSFYENVENPGGNSYYRENSELSSGADILYTEAHRRVCRGMTLDTVIRDKQFPAADLIKMDVQGAELDVLMGANAALQTAKHVILELQQVEYNKGAPLRDQIINYMNMLGFDCKGIFCDNGPDGDYHFVRR